MAWDHIIVGKLFSGLRSFYLNYRIQLHLYIYIIDIGLLLQFYFYFRLVQ